MAKKTIQQALAKSQVVLHKDFSPQVKPADVYFLRLGSASLDTPVAVKMTLPAGDYLIIAQGFIYVGGAEQHAPTLAFQLSYRQGSKTVKDDVVFTLEPGAPAYNALLSCAVSADSPHHVQFSFASDGSEYAGVNGIKITAIRIGSLKIVAN